MTKENRENFQKQYDATIGSWYKVCYIKDWTNYGTLIFRNNDILYNCCSEKLRVDNINGWGIGFIYFINENDQLVYLPWSAIISMIPIKEI